MKINKNIALSETGFVFDPTNGDSYSLNPVGAEIIQHLKNDKSVKEIINFLSKKYDVEANQLEKDILDFIITLEHFHLIENND